ncbi:MULTISPECIES: helix-turn-helix transcriptional regulator [Ralstonia]|uniref:AlpA family phage regulatory protein n=2 Tax=Ralstonia pickettii TaxID=329 RepID=A0ABN9I8A6_RALPI|nr:MULTISPECIES: AlpA family phage regulatory protein [Ralstonia]CAJ0732864.1 hypothetical protein R38712_05114 [Ralstonia pickettii]
MANKSTPTEARLVLPQDGVSRFTQIAAFLPFSRETWRKLVRDGKAPQPIRIGDRCTVWKNADIHAWLASPNTYQVN